MESINSMNSVQQLHKVVWSMSCTQKKAKNRQLEA